ncbi:MAG: UMP kinase, partial [Verrucomicrobiota bacterium]|nr:UMP kinase [Verrucomicrobiota bacterium]
QLAQQALRRVHQRVEQLGVLQPDEHLVRLHNGGRVEARELVHRHLERGRVVIFAGGTGNPYFSTDTAAALRANEIGADMLMKATQVDGIYNKDPKKHDNAVKYDHIPYVDALRERLEIMDSTAFSLCMENQLPILVFSMREPGSIHSAVMGEEIGTLVD